MAGDDGGVVKFDILSNVLDFQADRVEKTPMSLPSFLGVKHGLHYQTQGCRIFGLCASWWRLLIGQDFFRQ